MAQNQGKDGKSVQKDSGMSDQNRNAASSKDQQSKQSGQQSQQSGQQGSQQHGGQHASGGTPALDDIGGKKKGETAQDAAQAFNQQDTSSKKR